MYRTKIAVIITPKQKLYNNKCKMKCDLIWSLKQFEAWFELNCQTVALHATCSSQNRNIKKQYILHFFILINLYHAQPTTSMYNSLAFFVHKPLTFLQITFCYFGMNHIVLLYQTQKWFLKYPLTAFTFFKFHSNRKTAKHSNL